MQVPEWATDKLRSDMSGKLEAMNPVSGFKVRTKTLVDNYSTFFAEYEKRDRDLLVHFFPRAGTEDKWSFGHYLPKCRSCGAARPEVQTSRTTPCQNCGHVGLIYIPGRAEVKVEAFFPASISALLKDAVDAVWDGEVAIDPVDELGAIVVQIQGAGTIPDDKVGGMLETMCDRLDADIDGENL